MTVRNTFERKIVRSFIDKMYKIAFRVNLTDWMDRPDLIPMGQNVNWLTRGLVETPGREYQSSYDPSVRPFFRFTNDKF